MRLDGLPSSSVTPRPPSEIDRVLDSVATFTRRLYTRTADVFMDAAEDPAQALHNALDSLLHDLAAAPEMTYMSIVELPRLGPLVGDRQHRMLDLFADFLQPGFAARGIALPDPQIVSLCITGGLWRIVRQHALDRRLQELPDSLPAISYVVLSTFFGVQEALRVSASIMNTSVDDDHVHRVGERHDTVVARTDEQGLGRGRRPDLNGAGTR
jgi:hypothetical protein